MPQVLRTLLSILVVIVLTISTSGWTEAFAGGTSRDASNTAMGHVGSRGAADHHGPASRATACQDGAVDCEMGEPDGHLSSSCCAASCHLGIPEAELALLPLYEGSTVHVPSKSEILADQGVSGLLRPPRMAGILVG